MNSIQIDFSVALSPGEAYQTFVEDFNDWWPAEYTWSQDQLKTIYIVGEVGGLCTEIGPHGFRCDWGRVTELEMDHKLVFKWQIGPRREPIPDPEKASDIKVIFQDQGGSTMIRFEHYNFEKHGEGADEYRQMMSSEYGWAYILDRYQKHCKHKNN